MIRTVMKSSSMQSTLSGSSMGGAMHGAYKPVPTWLILGSYLVAMLLLLVPLPWVLIPWRPEFLLLVMVYWLLYEPARSSLFTAWFAGLWVDAITGGTFGLNALAFTVVAAFVRVLYQRLLMFDVLQQAGVMFLLVGIYQLVMLWGQTFQGGATLRLDFLMSCFTSAVSWPLVVVLTKRFSHAR